jgi:multiple sugar transport system ATP-binding protein
MNFVPAKSAGVEGGVAKLTLPGAASVAIPLQGKTLPASGDLTVGIRPEHLTLSEAGIGLKGRVRLAEHLGAETMLYVELEGGTEAIVRADGLCKARPGDTVGLGLNPAACHIFGPDGAAIVNGSLI